VLSLVSSWFPSLMLDRASCQPPRGSATWIPAWVGVTIRRCTGATLVVICAKARFQKSSPNRPMLRP
jgi:hypothetical protein